MSGPSFKNIDLWLFELAEGNLTPAQEEQLEMFLLQYPEIDVERDVWNMAKVQPQAIHYPHQDQLIKKRPVGWFYFASAASLALLFTIAVSDYSIIENSYNSELLASKTVGDSKITLLEEEVAQLKARLKESSSTLQNENELANGASQPLNSNVKNDFASQVNDLVKYEKKSLSLASIDHNQFSPITNNEVEILKEENYLADSNKKNDNANDKYESVNQNESILISDNNGAVATHEITDVIAKKYEKEYKFPTSNKSTYSTSLKSKFKKVTRAFQRMMNNPIALTNYRDPSFHLPGVLNNDINFSSAGTMLATRFQAMSRLQWYGQDNEQLMNQLAVDGYVYGMRGGLGLQINHSMYKNGAINVASAALTYSPKISVNKSISVEPSIRFKMGAKSLNTSKMEGFDKVELDRQNVYDYYSDGETPIGNELWYKDLGVGLMVNTEWFYIGAQVDNLFRHHDNMYSTDILNQHKASNHFIGVIGTDWVSLDKTVGLSPYILYQQNENLSELWAGLNFRYNWLVVGGGISSLLDPGASLELKFDHVSFKYNADYTISGMTNQRSLSHQLTLKFVGKTSRFGRRILNK